MNKIIRDFIITFLALAIISATLYFTKNIDLVAWYWKIIIPAIMIGVPYYFHRLRN